MLTQFLPGWPTDVWWAAHGWPSGLGLPAVTGLSLLEVDI